MMKLAAVLLVPSLILASVILVKGGCSDGKGLCDWLNWNAWGSCGRSCGGGRQERNRGMCCKTSLAEDWYACLADCGKDSSDSRDWSYCNEICLNGGSFVHDINYFGGGRCRCTNLFTGICCSNTLPDAPEITASVPVYNNGVRATEGQALTVTCVSRGGNPVPTVAWYKRINASQLLVKTNSGTLVGDTFTVTLSYKFTPTRQDDRQQLVCQSYWPITADSSGLLATNVTVYLYFMPLEVSIDNPTENLIANGQNAMSIICTSGTSNPVSVITWETGNISIGTPSHVDSPGEYGGTVRTSTIRFNPTREHDGTTIKCSAQNNITGLHEVSSSTDINNIIYPPLIVDIHDRDVTEGDIVTLPCRASSKPPATFTWRHGSVVVSTGQGTPSYNGFNYTIHNVSRTNAGTYTCTADNQVQPSDSKQAALRVLTAPATGISSLSDVIIGGAVAGGLVGAVTVVVVVGVVVWRRRGSLLLGKRNTSMSTGKRKELFGLERNKSKVRTETSATYADHEETKTYESLKVTGDTQCYEQLQANTSIVPQHEYDNTGISLYEILQTNRVDAAQTHDHLHSDCDYQATIYENLKL